MYANQLAIYSALYILILCRLRQLLGYTKEDLIGSTPFNLHHHEDTEATLQCSKGGEFEFGFIDFGDLLPYVDDLYQTLAVCVVGQILKRFGPKYPPPSTTKNF